MIWCAVKADSPLVRHNLPMKRFVLGLLVGWSCIGAEYPSAEISNGEVKAKLYLPDLEKGSYHGTRFDWSGIITSLQYKGHEYFGQWYEKHDPKIHDAITGPVEEYTIQDAEQVRLGVGVVKKPDTGAYKRFETYDIEDPGKWTVNKNPHQIEFIHELKGPDGLAYRYAKMVRLEKDKPRLVLEHTLRNTGQHAIDLTQYNHNFFVIDNEVVGPEVVVCFPFAVTAKADWKDMAQVRGNDIVYSRELQKGESVASEIEGFGADAKAYDFRIENRKSGAGVHITGDQPLARIYFWSIRSVACPEPYIHLRVEPGQQIKWQIAYDFYTLPGS